MWAAGGNGDLVSHPPVAEAAAIGVPDPMKGETIRVFVQVRSDHVASDALSAAPRERPRQTESSGGGSSRCSPYRTRLPIVATVRIDSPKLLLRGGWLPH